MYKKPGKPKVIREINQRLIVDEIKRNHTTSRAELSKRLNLSEPSISRIIELLLKKGLLYESGEGIPAGGRKPIMLQLNQLYMYVVGIDLSSDKIRVALGDLNEEIVDIEYFNRYETTDGLLDNTIKCIHALLERNNVALEKLGVITIGIPGVVNNKTGEILLLPKWLNDEKIIDIKQVFSNEFNTKVIIINDIKLMAFGESHHGEGKKYKNLIFINVDKGVGSGIIINREIFFGDHFASGEIGYWHTSPESLENEGSFESLNLEKRISVSSVVENIKKDLTNGAKSIIWDLTNNDLSKIDFDIIKKAILAKDPYSFTVLKKIAKYLGWSIINAVSLLDIESIILSGEVVKLSPFMEEEVQKILCRYIPQPFSIVITPSEIGNKAGVLGAFTLGTEYIFENLLFS